MDQIRSRSYPGSVDFGPEPAQRQWFILATGFLDQRSAFRGGVQWTAPEKLCQSNFRGTVCFLPAALADGTAGLAHGLQRDVAAGQPDDPEFLTSSRRC